MEPDLSCLGDGLGTQQQRKLQCAACDLALRLQERIQVGRHAIERSVLEMQQQRELLLAQECDSRLSAIRKRARHYHRIKATMPMVAWRAAKRRKERHAVARVCCADANHPSTLLQRCVLELELHARTADVLQ